MQDEETAGVLGGPASDDALEACLLYATEILGQPIPASVFFRDSRGESSVLDVDRSIELVQQMGLQAAFGKIALKDLNEMLLPALLFMKGGHVVVLEAKSHDSGFIVFDPKLPNGSGVIREDHLAAEYSGCAMIIRIEKIRKADEHSIVSGHWFWESLLAHRWSYFQVVVAAFMINLLGLSTSVFVMVVYDRVLPNEAIESLVALSLGVAIALIFDFAIKTLRATFLDRAGQSADQKMGRLIFDQLLDVRLSQRRGTTGSFANTLREFETLREFFTSATLITLVDLPFVLIFLGVIYLIGGPLALVPLLAVPIVIGIGISIQPIMSKHSARIFREGQQKQSVLVETVAGLEAVKAVGAGRHMRARWEDAIERQAEFSTRSRSISQFALNATMLVQQIAQVAIVVFGVFLIMEGRLSMGALIASVMLTGRALAPLGQLAQALTRLHHARTSYQAIDSLMRAEREHPQGRNWLSRPRLSGKIDFEAVSFTYPGSDMLALRDISFSIAPGEKVAILGRIGCGKSTIARLLLGLYQPTSGAILVDNTDLRQVDPEDLRRNIGVVLQDPWLFSGSVRQNIAVGAARPGDADILRAAELAGVDCFISRHRAGYDLAVGERGEGLSGGQRQAITVARALVGRPPILLMDEPTSAIDSQSELQMIQRLKSALHSETVVIITHRTSLLALVDRVIVVDQGRVIADGPKSIVKVGTVPLHAGAA